MREANRSGGGHPSGVSAVLGRYRGGTGEYDRGTEPPATDRVGGSIGERASAHVLNELVVDGGPAVLHELFIAVPGIRVNIDHAVVAADTVILVGSETWEPGFHWTLWHRTHRGRTRLPMRPPRVWTDTHTAVARHLRHRGVEATVVRPLVAVWSTDPDRPVATTFVRIPGARVVAGAGLQAAVARIHPLTPGHADVVDAMDALREPMP